MVSYYNTAAMYRNQQALTSPNGHFQNPTMHGWYPGYQSQMAGPTGSPMSYCVQEEQQMWGHHSHFQHDFQDFVGHPHHQMHFPQHLEQVNQLPSPPMTVSGSEMSSPGGGNSPQNQRPPPARSPYEWIKKTSYQSQPQPELECLSSQPMLLDFGAPDSHGKTRTKDKYRVVYTDHQRIELEKEFTFNNKYITIRRKSELAANLGLSERQIKIWFQNRRAKERKQNKKRVEEKNMDAMNNMAPHNFPHPLNPVLNQHQLLQQQMNMDQHHQQQIPTVNPMLTDRFMDQSLKVESESDPLG